MADRTNYQRRTNSSYTRNASYGRYVSGNLAHQLEEVPQRRQQPQRRRRTRVYPKQKAVAMVSISAGSFFFLMVAGLITLAFCFNYLRVQSGITQMKNEVVALNNRLAYLREKTSGLTSSSGVSRTLEVIN